MSDEVEILHASLLVMLLAPPLSLVAMAVPSLLRRPLPEAAISRITRASSTTGFLAAATGLVTHVASGEGPLVVSFGTWFSAGEAGFSFDFLLDPLSLGFALLSTGLCGVVAAFSSRYLHREPGFTRYFVLFAMFVWGISLVSVAGSVEVLFAGWELLGLSSALLVAFFQDRPAPVANALRVFAVYRISDAAMLVAAVLLHHFAGSGSLAMLFSGAPDTSMLSTSEAVLIASLIIAAVAGKSALLPLSGWLPRAMEGPTPSSAVFYGALSIHAGCFLLLRAEPLLAQSVLAQCLAGAAGATTAIYATLVARVQTDVKSALTYAALTQVGIIVTEIACGLTTLAFVHIVGHASYRLLQFLSAPNILHDLHDLEGKLGPADATPEPQARTSVGPARRAIYLAALERGFLDVTIDRVVVGPLARLVHLLDRFDRLLCGGAPARHGRDDR